MRLLTWLGFLLGIWLIAPTAAQEEYTSEDGFFTVTLPADWDATTTATHIHLSKANDSPSLYLLIVDAESNDRAIEQGLAQLDIVFGEQANAIDAPFPNGIWRQHIYVEGTSLVLGLSRIVDGRAVVLIGTGEQSAFQAINPQIIGLVSSIQLENETINQAVYVNQDAFTERDTSFGEAPYILSGTLSLPHGDGPFPAVVIIHGSGPTDRNGTVGMSMPYRDIAQGLASNGIGVLRFDKRTLTHAQQVGAEFETFTVDDESTDDALLAVEYLKQQNEIDASRIFVMGHSQGAALAPRIASRSDDLAGIIMLSTQARSFSELVRTQIAYVGKMNPDALKDPSIASLNNLVASFERVAEGVSYAEAFGAQAVYFQSVEELDPITTALDLSVPILILQGERDYQITMTDFELWQTALADKDNARLISYPTLNHLFMSQGDVSRLAIPQDYAEPAFVDDQVIDDIVNWISETNN